MSDEPYLLAIIAHGKPVFEIGYRMECPICEGLLVTQQEVECTECDAGIWWITNTGHRARTYWHKSMDEILMELAIHVPDPPDDWPDHFQSYIDRTPTPSARSSLLAQLGLAKPKARIQRRELK